MKDSLSVGWAGILKAASPGLARSPLGDNRFPADGAFGNVNGVNLRETSNVLGKIVCSLGATTNRRGPARVTKSFDIRVKKRQMFSDRIKVG